MGVIMPHYDASRQIEDRFNVVLRHCRIGKVTEKVRPAPVLHPFKGIMSPHPVIPGVFSLPHMHEVCRNCIGACGNAACPSRPFVTCAA